MTVVNPREPDSLATRPVPAVKTKSSSFADRPTAPAACGCQIELCEARPQCSKACWIQPYLVRIHVFALSFDDTRSALPASALPTAAPAGPSTRHTATPFLSGPTRSPGHSGSNRRPASPFFTGSPQRPSPAAAAALTQRMPSAHSN